ncbi:MAG: hypothetical protein ACE5HH_05650, partial [Candidatus Hydrothermarchaeales archaeon]
MDALTLKTGLLCHGIDTGGEVIKSGRKGGAGPAGACFEINDILVNAFTIGRVARSSPFKLKHNDGLRVTFKDESFPLNPIHEPQYYSKLASDGTPMKKIALLHGRD